MSKTVFDIYPVHKIISKIVVGTNESEDIRTLSEFFDFIDLAGHNNFMVREYCLESKGPGVILFTDGSYCIRTFETDHNITYMEWKYKEYVESNNKWWEKFYK